MMDNSFYYYESYDPAEVPSSPLMVQYEQNRRKDTDERDAVQKKTFTKWLNKHLMKTGRRVVDLFEDLRDGHNLISLLEVLAHDLLPRERGHMRFHKIQNVQIALQFLRHKGIKLVNIRSDEIVDGNPKLTLGLIWTIILHFQVSDVVVPGQEDISAKEALLLWSRRTCEGYPGVKLTNFSSSWRDGKAFLSILHRNRPDIIDFRKTQGFTNRQNLDLAFGTAEREFGVTRLLDPEDVDVPRPDEKSIITYVSSLYDVFPEVPSVEQTLLDNERQLKTDEYRDLVTSLLHWLRDSTAMMMEQNFPSTLTQLKALFTEFNRFRVEDVPPRLNNRQKLLQLFDEIQSINTNTSHLGIEEDLFPEALNRHWNRFTVAQQERESSLQAELVRLERLQRLAEKIHRECKHGEDSLDEIDRRIREEEKRIDIVHPSEAKRNCDALDRALKNIEDAIRTLFRDVQALQDGRFATADQLYGRVSNLQSRISQLRTKLFSDVIQKLMTKSHVEDQFTTTRHQIRLAETSPTFRHIQDCLKWIESKQGALDQVDCGHDLSSVQATLEEHRQEHQDIHNFRTQIEKCVSDRMSIPPGEQTLYTEWLSKAEVAYSLLTNTSSRRLKCLESLIEFVQAATQELIWLNEREEVELSRDWSSQDLNLPQTEEFFQNLMHELQVRESQFNSVQERGEAMVLDRHPASSTIDAYMKAMQSQWSWLLQLTVCLDSHVKQASSFFQFFEDVRTCGQWLSQQEDLLHHRYSRDELSIEEMEQFLRELQSLHQQINAKEREISTLVETSHNIVPLRQRSIAVVSPIKVVCLCSYKQPTMTLQKGDNCILINSGQRIKWKVKNSSGQEELVPSVCFMIPPPNPETIDQAERLKKRLDHLQVVWRSCQRRIRHDMVLSTIAIIKGWDLKQFMSLEPSRREAFWKAVVDDAEKLITEVGENDREMRRLRDELETCSQIFVHMSTAAVDEEARKARTPDQDFMRQVESLSHSLKLCDQTLTARLHEPLPRNMTGTGQALRQQKDWEKMVRGHEGELDQIKHSFATLTLKTPQVESNLNLLTQKWDHMWSISHVYIERLKTIDLIVPGLDSVRQFVIDTETRLAAYDNMTSDRKSLIRIQKELEGLKILVNKQQLSLSNLKSATATLHNLVQDSRPGAEEHPDLDNLEQEVTALSTRWDNMTTQISERLTTAVSAADLLSVYTTGLHNEEAWVAETQLKVKRQPPVSDDVEQAKQLLEPTVAIYNSLAEQQHQIEAVNRHGGQYIREAKIYDKKLRQYRTTLDHGASSFVDGVSKRIRVQDGAETVKTEMDSLNRNYIEMIRWAHSRLKQIASILSLSGIDVQMYIQQDIPLLRTFRAELAKRSSMLVDEDMQEFFQQLADFEGYGNMPAEFYGASNKTFISQVSLKPFQSATDSPTVQRTLHVSKVGSCSDEIDAPRHSSGLTSLSVEVSPSRTMHPPSISPGNLSQKIANITSISVFCQGDKTCPIETFHQPKHAQTLITVKQGQVAPKGSIVHVAAILNTKTGRKVNLVEAVKTGLLDVKSMSIIDPDSRRKINMSEASRRGLITSELQYKLKAACGIQDLATNKNCSLSEALQKELFNPVRGSVMDPSLGRHIPVQQAVERRIISKDTARTLCGEGATVTMITQTQAVFGELDLSAMEAALGLAEVIDKGLYVKSTGQIRDPLSGKQMTLLSAVEKGFINPLRKEVRDSETYISLTEAVTRGIIDPIAGCYNHPPTGRKIPLDEAYQSWELNKAVSLPTAMKTGLLSESGQFVHPNSGRVLSFREALSSGLLDGDTKCIVDPQTNSVTSINESIKAGLIDVQNAHIPTPSGDSESLSTALVQGHIKLVDVDMTFPMKCISDTQSGDTVTLAEAMKRGIITTNGDFVDTRSGRKILLRAAASQGLVNKDIADLLVRESSMKDSSGKSLSFMKSIQMGLFDPERGELRDPISKSVIPVQVATLKGVISTEDAQSLLELLGSATTHTTITTKLQPGQQGEFQKTVSVAEAIAQGLLIECNGTFCDPNTGTMMSVEEAIGKGLLRLSSEWPSSLGTMCTGGVDPVADSNCVKKNEHGYSFTQTTISHPAVSQTVVQETRNIIVQKVVDPKTNQLLDVQEAINRGLLDVSRGLYLHPVTGEKVEMKEAIDRGYVVGTESSDVFLPGSVQGTAVKQTKSFSITGVIHPKTGQKLTVSQAIKEGILNREKGFYYGVDNRGYQMSMPISEAVEKGFVIANDVSESAMTPGGGFVHEMKTFQLKSVVHPITKQQIAVKEAIKEGIIDEHNGFYFNMATGEKLTIPEAIEKGLIDAELVSVTSDAEGDGSKVITTKLTTLTVTWVIDPRTGETISIVKAIDQGIVDQNHGLYINPATGETMSINDAIDKKLVIVQSANTRSSSSRSDISSIHITDEQEFIDANVIEDIHSETVTLSISSVIDPRTMEMITYDDAVLHDIIDLENGVYRNPVTGEAMAINIAIEKGLIHGEVTSKISEEDLLKSTVVAEAHSFPIKNITSVLDPRTGEEISADTAVKEEIIDIDKGTFFDCRSRENISLESALKQGFINLSKASNEADLLKVHVEKVHLPPTGPMEDVRPSYVDMKLEKTGTKSETDTLHPSVADEVLNYSTEVEESASGAHTSKTPSVFVELDENMTVEKALKAFGIKTESKSASKSEIENESQKTPEPLGLSYDQIVRLGLLDKSRGKIRDPRTGRLMNLKEAISAGLLDPDKVALVNLSTGDILTLRDCFRKGIVDPTTGKINNGRANAEKLALSPHHTSRVSSVKPLNLLDAVEAGLFDEDTCKIMDPTNGQIWNLGDASKNNIIDGNLVIIENPGTHCKAILKSALQQGYIDGSTAYVVNSVTGEKIPLCESINRGFVKHAYQADSGTLYDPLTGQVVSLEKALTSGQLKSNEGCVIDTVTGENIPLDVAFKRGMLDRKTGAVLDKKTGKKISPQDAVKLGLLTVIGAPVLASKAVYEAISARLGQDSAAVTVNGDMQKTVADQQRPTMTIVYAKPEDRIRASKPRQPDSTDGRMQRNGDVAYPMPNRMVESYDKLVQDLHNQMNWLSDMEQILRDDLPISDEAFKVLSQLQTQQGLHNDILKHQQPILSLVYQGEQFVEHQQEELTPEQVTELQNLTAAVKATFNKVVKTSDSRLKHMGFASEELAKFEEEQKKFETWMASKLRELSMQEDTVRDLDYLRRITDQHKELSNEVIAHQADLRFLSMAVGKYMEEVKLHKLELDAYKAGRQRSNRCSWLGMEGMEAEAVRDKLRDTTSHYHNLRDKCSAFGDRLATLNAKQKDFNDNTWKMLSWLTEAEEKLSASKHEPSASEPDAFHEHLDKMKAISSDAIAHGVQLVELQKSGNDLSESFHEMSVDPFHVQKMQEIIHDVMARHTAVTSEINDRTKGLQASLTKSQDVHAAMDNLLSWLRDTETTLTNQRPISLSRENLNDQIQEMKVLETDIENHKNSMDSVKQAASELMKTCDLDMAKSLEGKLGDMESRFVSAQSRCNVRTKDLYGISDALSQFQDSAEHCTEWLVSKIEVLESKDWIRLDGKELKDKVDAISDESRANLPIDETKNIGQTLVEDERTGNVGSVKETIIDLDRNYHDFQGLLSQRQGEAAMKESQGHEYELAKTSVVEWLSSMESEVDGFEPVAVDIEVVETQIEELQPLLQGYEDFVETIDDINDLGNNFDALQNPERPSSPVRRMLRTHRLSSGSPRLRSPSPAFLFPSSSAALSPSSESSGVSSRKSSSDNLLLEDLTETQQEIVDMNQRYEILGERLADRQQELRNMLDNVKIFLQDLADLLTWLDLKEQEVEIVGPIPTSEKAAKKKLKEYELFHQELIQKEGLVEEIRQKVQELVKTKPGQPGIDDVRQQLADLEEKWLGTKVSSEQRRKLLEDVVADLRSFKESGLHLQKWVAQKVKMIDALGPITTEPSLIQFQMKQVKVLEEEVRNEEPTYETFLQSAHSILDKSEADDRDAEHVSRKIKDISKAWDGLQTRLRDRSNSLSSIVGLGSEFSNTMQDVQESVIELNAKFEQLGPISAHPQKHPYQMVEVEELQEEVAAKTPALERCRELCKKLTDITKDSSTKFQLKNKMANLEKPISDIDKKLAARKLDLELATSDGKKFHLSCQDLLSWLDDSRGKLSSQEPLSGQIEVLRDQSQQHKLILKDIDDHQPEINSVLGKARDILDGSTTTPESQELSSKIEELHNKWEELTKGASDRNEQLETSAKHAEQFRNHLDKMLLWLQLSDEKLDGLLVESLDSDSVAKKLKDARGLQRDILKMSHDHEILNKEGHALASSVDCDKDHVNRKLDEVNTRWDDLTEAVGTKVQDLDDMSQRLSEYQDNVTDTRENLRKLQGRLETHSGLGTAAKDPKYLDKLKTLQDDISSLHSPMDYIKALVDGFAYGPEGSTATAQLIANLEEMKHERDEMQHNVGTLVDEMEAGSRHLVKFQDKLQAVSSHVSDVENDFSRFCPVGRDENSLASQQRETEELLSHLTDVEDQIFDVETACQDIVGHGYLTDPRVTQSQLDSLKKQFDKLKEKTAQRKDGVAVVAAKVEEVDDTMRRTRTSVDRANDELEMHQPVGNDVGSIKGQQNELKEYMRSVLDPLHHRVEKVTSDAQQLVHSAAPGVSTSGLESDLEILTDKWANLNEKFSERDRILDGALLKAGKFNDAFESLINWLKETEEMVANQKPPSPEFKVCKAQLQEQKFLLKMLDDRAPSIKSVQECAVDLQKTLDPREQKGIQNQIAQLEQHWEVLTSGAGVRMKVLDEMIGLAKEFQEMQNPLIIWLDVTEKKFASLEPSVMDTDGVENIIIALKDIQSDLNKREQPIKTLAMKAKELQNLCKGDDIKNIQKKIDDVQNRFSSLRDKLTDTLEQMEEALPLVKNFNDAHSNFLDWITKVEPELKCRDSSGAENDEDVQRLVEKLEEIQPILEIVNSDGSQLTELAPGDAGLKIEDMITKDNKQFEGISEQIQMKVDKLRVSKQKSSEIIGDIDDLLDWFGQAKDSLLQDVPISREPSRLLELVEEQKALNDDIQKQRSKGRDLIAVGRRLVREGSVEGEGDLQHKMDELKQCSDDVVKLGADKLSHLEKAMPLAKLFEATHQELNVWLDEVEPALIELEVMSINEEQVKKQQDNLKLLKQDIQDHKPLCDKLNKTGSGLIKLCGEADGSMVQDTLDRDNKRITHILSGVGERSSCIDEALQQSAEFTDKLENMMENLEMTKGQIENAEPISAHPDKIREQLADSKAVLEDLAMRRSALDSVRTTAEDLIKQAKDEQDEAVKDVKQKLDDLIQHYDTIQSDTQGRTKKLEDTLEVSEKFWDELQTLMCTLKDLQESISNQEAPALEPAIIREQQDTLEALKDDLDNAHEDASDVHATGDLLLNMCGEPDRPELQKNIDDLDFNVMAVTEEYEKRSKTLENALSKAIQFQDELMKILVWLQKHEEKLREMAPVAKDFDTIKKQWADLKTFKEEVEPKQVEIEALNQQANELVKDTTDEQSAVVIEPMSTVNLKWDFLMDGIGDRERKLQLGMLNIGQFEHAINQIIAWLDKADQTLDEAKPIYGDARQIEMEMSRHKVLQNDISGHTESINSLKNAGQQVISGGKSQAATAPRKVADMMRLWNVVQSKACDRQDQLEDALQEAKRFSEGLQKTLMHLADIEGILITSRPIGGLPETAKEQLEKFLNVHTDLEKLEPRYKQILQDGDALLTKCREPAIGNIKQKQDLLMNRWESINTRSDDRKNKLEEAVSQAISFHDDLSQFIAWLTETERNLNNLHPVSRVIDRVTPQIEDHRVLQKDITKNREAMIALDKTGTHLKYFSQKPDVVVIKNMLASVHQRWEKIVSRSAERTRHLERGYKEAKQFSEKWKELLDWLVEAEVSLDTDTTVTNDPANIKAQIIKHKVFQRSLGAKQPAYDGVNRTGRGLKDRCTEDDIPPIQLMLSEVRNQWNHLCGCSVDRQRKLEEALLFSGQFNEALQALLDWLAKVEPTLGDDQPVHGDIDTVNNLMEGHKAFQQELGARAITVQFVQKRARELMDKSEEDTSQQQAQLIELSTMWDRVCKLSVNKQERLEQAHKLAADFHKKAHEILDWLAGAERGLRYRGAVADDEMGLLKQIEEHKKFEEELLREETVLRETLNIGQDIMKRCHPDAVSTLKHWLSVLRARWEEVTNWSRQRGRKVGEQLTLQRRNNKLLEDLLAWINNAETQLSMADREAIPQDIDIIKHLIEGHQEFQNEMTNKQPDVDNVTRAEKRRTTSTSVEPGSHIPVLTGMSGRRTPVKRTPSKHPDSPGRRTPEPHFKNPRVGALFNKWRHTWLMAMEHQRKLQDALDYLNEVERLKDFKFDDWRKRYLKWMNHNKSRIMDFFRRKDRDHDGRVTRKEFIEGILQSKFPTSDLEMETVANVFDRDGDGFIDYKEFVSALRPDREPIKTATDSEKIQDEVSRQVHQCTCVKQFKIHKIGEGKYRFGDSQKLRLVRILRSTVMVRVGGGWVALDEFLVKNDPCRAKGRTNLELREQFILAEGVSQSMSGFTSRSPSGSSYSGSSTYSGAGSWSTQSPSSASGPVTKIREKTQYISPWKQRVKTSPDREVRQILSRRESDGTKVAKTKLTRDMKSPHDHVCSPAIPSRSSSRASTSSRPASRGSEFSETSEPEVYTTLQSETRNIGGRNQTTLTYQTHVVETRTVKTPTSSTRVSKIPKPSPRK